MAPRTLKLLAGVAGLLELPLLSFGYTWQFQQTPTQCGQLTIQVSGNDGQPPYRVLIVPFGPTVFQNGTEVRTISEQNFDGSSTSVTFQLKYPTNSQFVAVVSDKSGFGSGGTSAAATVTASNDSSCFDASKSVSPPWFIHLDPNSIVQSCSKTRIWWDSSAVQGNPTFQGIIPGGNAFNIPQGQVSQQPGTGTGFDWVPNIREGTILNIVGSDDRGTGSGGSFRGTVTNNLNNDVSCLNGMSPSSTAGPPAGGSYPTDTSGNRTPGTGGGGGSSGGSNTGAIVGGVVGGVVFLIAVILILLCFRKRNKRKGTHEKPDLLHADEGDESHRRQELPQYYEPEPFLVPDPTVASSERYRDDTSSDGRPLSMATSEGPSAMTSGTRKTAPRPFRAVNIIQHDDAGPSEVKPPGEADAETIELPPAYTNIRQ